jgi:hypothetical protein
MDDLLAFLSDAASKGEPCPNNTVIHDLFNLPSVSQVNPLFLDLEADGAIVVERTGNRRRVTIVATGASTAWTEYYRGRPRLFVGTAGPGETARPIEGFRGDLPPERYLDRDPCPRCGVRGDLGCAHSRRLAA